MGAKAYDRTTAAFAAYVISNIPKGLAGEAMDTWMQDPGQLKAFLEGLSDPALITEIDTGSPLSMMIQAGKYGSVHPDVTYENFPTGGFHHRRFRNRLFHFGSCSTANAKKRIEDAGFVAATHVHGLAFGARYPRMILNHSIVCLGHAATIRGVKQYLVLCRNGAKEERHIGTCMDNPNCPWLPQWRFLGVQEIAND